MSIINKLTEGITRRDLSKEGAALLNKWEKTGLLEGLSGERAKHGMAALLENQAKELLREASTMAGGDVEGFASVAFPIVRRVFGGLIANDLVSVQPMSLPSGLIFFLDFTFQTPQGGDFRLGAENGASVYGGGKIGSQITGGIDLSMTATGNDLGEESFYALNNGYSSPTGSAGAVAVVCVASGTVGTSDRLVALNSPDPLYADYAALGDRLVRFDPDLSGSNVAVGVITGSALAQLNKEDLVTITIDDTGFTHGRQVRRLTRIDPLNPSVGYLVVLQDFGATSTLADLATELDGNQAISWAETDDFVAGNAVGSVVGTDTWGLENNTAIPEIDIKVDSVAVTAVTKKLKAKWTPELAQDLNAYHNLDAEVELTSILSEHIALEIDQEILEDLV